MTTIVGKEISLDNAKQGFTVRETRLHAYKIISEREIKEIIEIS